MSVPLTPPRAGLSPHTRLQWRRGADAPEVFYGASAVVMGESVYVGGGVIIVLYPALSMPGEITCSMHPAGAHTASDRPRRR